MITTVVVAGMRSEHCKRAVFTALTPVPGIRAAEVFLGGVTIDHDGAATHDMIRTAIESTGYVVVSIEDDRSLPIVDPGSSTRSSMSGDDSMEMPR